MSPGVDGITALQLADWRRRVAELYGQARATADPRRAWETWRAAKQQLYRHHPQSPIPPEVRAAHVFLCFDHDPAMRVAAALVPAEPRHLEGDGVVPGMTRVGTLRFTVGGVGQQLDAFWLDGYAGGLFVPFADATSGSATYGGGRYVIDAAKGADLGAEGDEVVLDFNFAFAPSCAHDPRWRCPLAPPGNRLAVAIRAGERLG